MIPSLMIMFGMFDGGEPPVDGDVPERAALLVGVGTLMGVG